MAIALPDYPSPARQTVRLVTARAELTSAFGPGDQRFNRMGSRYAFDVDLPVMTYQDAQDWSDIDDETATVTLQIVQPGLDTGAPGSDNAVDGSGQSGSTLDIKGLTPGYVLRKRQFISITTSGRLHAYRVKTETVADAAGLASVPLETMLRIPHLDDDVVEIAEPRIEGFCTVPDGAWTTNEAGHVALSFSIRERI